MTESPDQMPGGPPEEVGEGTDIADRLEEDPRQVPNAPNRDPRDGAGSSVVPPDEDDERG